MLFFAALSYYFPYEVSDYTAYRRWTSTDVTKEPEWWIEITGLVALLFIGFDLLFSI